MEENNESKYYVAADCDSRYFDDYDEAYAYAKDVAEKTLKGDPDTWDEVHLMDNEEWVSLVIFTWEGVHDLQECTFTKWENIR